MTLQPVFASLTLGLKNLIYWEIESIDQQERRSSIKRTSSSLKSSSYAIGFLNEFTVQKSNIEISPFDESENLKTKEESKFDKINSTSQNSMQIPPRPKFIPSSKIEMLS